MAGAYNLACGLFLIAYPGFVFDFCRVPPLNYPGIMQGLALVIGVYGVGYLHIASRPREGEALARVGLLGRVGGCIGWALIVMSGQLPVRSFPLIFLNDLAWLPGFLAYLKWTQV